MIPAAILTRLKCEGVSIDLKPDGKLALSAARPPRAEILDLVREHKEALVRLLREPSAEPASADNLMLAWRESLRDFEPKTVIGGKLRRASLNFLDTNLAAQAIETGWRELELFGVLNHADADVIARRADAKGAVTSVVLAPWEGTRLESFAASHAVIITGSGAILRQPKRPMNREMVVPFWMASAL